MKEAIIAIIVLGAIAWCFVVRVRAQAPPPSQEPSSERKMNPTDAGWALRKMMLTTSPASIGTVPTKEFPRIYGVLMDWPIGENTATIFSASDGSASLYTTSTFGIIGGQGHESVRNAAMKFVRAADRFYDSAAPTKEYPYPAAGHVRFYLLTYQGVRVIDADWAPIGNGTGNYTELFSLGQSVLTELRLVTDKAK